MVRRGRRAPGPSRYSGPAGEHRKKKDWSPPSAWTPPSLSDATLPALPVALTDSCPLLPARPARCSMLCSLRCRLGPGLASRLFRRPTARLAFAAAARRSGRSHPRPNGSDNPGCPPPRLCAPLAPALAHPAAPRHGHTPRSLRLSAPRIRAHTHPGPEPAAGKPAPVLPQAPKDRIPSLDAGTPFHPTPSASLSHAPRQPCSLTRRGVFTLLQFPTLCDSLSPRLSAPAPFYFLNRQAPQPATPTPHRPSWLSASVSKIPYRPTPTFSSHMVAPWRSLSPMHCGTAH